MVKSQTRNFEDRMECDKKLGANINRIMNPFGFNIPSFQGSLLYRNVVIFTQGRKPSQS